MAEYPLSTLARLYTQIPPIHFQGMVESIREEGLRHPITLWRGQIIDGRHRYEACLQAGVKPHFVELPDDADAFNYVLDENSARRHMSDSQRAIAAHRTWEEAASGWTGLGLTDGESANLHSLTLQQAADLFHVSRRLVLHAGRVFRSASQAIPELRQAADQGDVAVSDASRVVDQPPEVQVRALEMVQGGRSKTVARAARMVLSEDRDPQPDEGPGHCPARATSRQRNPAPLGAGGSPPAGRQGKRRCNHHQSAHVKRDSCHVAGPGRLRRPRPETRGSDGGDGQRGAPA